MKDLFIPLDLSLCKANKPLEKGKVIDYTFEASCSAGMKDAQGETLLQKGIDHKTYAHTRRLKWEHGSTTPRNNIGFVPKVWLDMNQDKLMFKGHIYAEPGKANYKAAQEAVDEIETIKAYNRVHSASQTLGVSLEGGKLQKSANGVVGKSFLTNIVLTNAPVNAGAVLSITKSFKTINDVSELFSDDDILTNYQIRQMQKSFNSKKDVRAFYKSLEMDETQIDEKVAQWEAKQEATRELKKSFDTVETLGTDLVNSLEKSLGKVKDPDKYRRETRDLDDAILPDRDNKVKVGEVLHASAKLQKSLADNGDENAYIILKSLQDLAKFQLAQTNLMKSLNEKLDESIDNSESIMDYNSELAKSLKKMDTGIAALAVGDEPAGEESGDDAGDKITYTKEQMCKALSVSAEKAYTEGNAQLGEELTNDHNLLRKSTATWETADDELKSFVVDFYKK